MDRKIIVVVLVALIVVSAGTVVVLSGWLDDTGRDKTWSSLTSVQEDNVYIFTGQSDNMFTRPGPRLVDGLEIMAKILYGDVFNVTIPYTMSNDYQEWITTAGDENYTNWDDANATASPVTLVDAEGRNVTTSEAPSRIVSCSPSLTEIVYALGLGDRLVAVTDYCDWPAEVTERKANGSLSSIGGYYTPSVENIAEADGDIILLDQDVQAQLDLLDQLVGMGFTVIVIQESSSFADVYESIQMVGDICWESDRAEGLVGSMQDRIESIQETIGTVDEAPSITFAVWLDPIYLSGNGTFANEMIGLVMGENVYGDMTGWPEVGLESLLERDPEYLLVSMMYSSTPAEDILQGLKDGELPSTTSSILSDLEIEGDTALASSSPCVTGSTVSGACCGQNGSWVNLLAGQSFTGALGIEPRPSVIGDDL